jgi:GH25 family lysozyme M1 (1,4-beta-N-acetylmuramidase)
VDWAVLSSKGVQFAYLKASQGTTWKDDSLTANAKSPSGNKLSFVSRL